MILPNSRSRDCLLFMYAGTQRKYDSVKQQESGLLFLHVYGRPEEVCQQRLTSAGVYSDFYALSLISLWSCCSDLTSALPCFCTYRMPFAVALAPAMVVMYGILPLIAAFLR